MVSWQNRLLVLFAVLSAPVFADQKDLLVNTFGGLNTQDSRAALQPYESPDLLNVNLQVGLKSVFKRDGYGLFQTLPINTSTTAVHGGYHFQQLSGNDVQLWGNDTELSGSVNDATFVKLATGTVSATWQCTDNLGFAYCVDSLNDTPVRTDGTAANTTFQTGIPAGTLITNTPTRLVVGGVSGSGSTLNFSQSNTFTNFTVGPLQTDPFTEVINAPGSRLTHIAYYFGKVYWFKDQSFGFADCQDQYNCAITIVSNQIGTLDNSSAFWNGTTFESGPNAFSSGASPYTSVGIIGGIFFRGQDNHIYVYDGYALTRLTRRITPTINSIARKKANSWTQSTQANFNNGVIVPAANLSTSIQPGVVIVSSFQAVENSSTQWTSGSNTNMSIYPSSITLSTNNAATGATNPNFELGSCTGGAVPQNWTSSPGTNFTCETSIVDSGCTLGPQSGSNFMYMSSGRQSCNPTNNIAFQILNTQTNSVLAVDSFTFTNTNCSYSQRTVTMPASAIGSRVFVRIYRTDGASCSTNQIDISSNSSNFILGGNITYWLATESDSSGGLTRNDIAIDNIQNGSSTITSGSFTSQVYNTGFTSATYSLNQFAWTANTSSPTFNLQTSANSNGPWRSILTSSATSAVGDQFAEYTTTISISNTDSAQTSITNVTILARSTGTYYSAVNNAPNLSTWGSLTETDATPGASSITYYSRASTNNFTVTSTTPAWVLQAKNATVAASTGTFMQLRADFSITAATEAPNLDAFTFNWFEGTASDKAYMTYFQDYIWIAVSSGTTGTNNRLLRLDLLNNTWLLDDIATNGFLVENNTLYLGDPIQGRVFKFGGVPTDNGNAINAYWQSKDFAGDDPTVQNEFQRVDFIFDVAQTTMTYTITLDQNVIQSILIPTTISAGTLGTITKRGFLLAPGKIGTFYNFRIGDNSSNPRWRMLFHNMKYTPLYWKPQTS